MAGLPAFLTVEEAARVLRIGRTTAYELAQRFLRTGGLEGLPVVRVGRSLRVPTARLASWAGGDLHAFDEVAAPPAPVVPLVPRVERRNAAKPRNSHRADQRQSPLPFTS